MEAYFDHFVIPFWIGVIFLFAAIAWKWGRWLAGLSRGEKRSVLRGFFSAATLGAAWEVFMESLIHRKIWRVDPRMGFMHMSLAFGWFLLIAVGWVEASYVLGGGPLHAHVFFRFFDTELHEGFNAFAPVMDLLLLFVLTGVALAVFKRLRSRALGMRRATRHVWIDKLALISLWCIFPLRLLAESFTAAAWHNGSFLTGGLGKLIESAFNPGAVNDIGYAMWWLYSIALGVFFVAMPFSRYMHIFTEIPLIFLRRYKLRSSPESGGSFDNFQIQSCSRCGICIDPCQLQGELNINDVQSVYYLRDRRYGRVTDRVLDNCLMCGACEAKCPVGIELNTLRLNGRTERMNVSAETRYGYVRGIDRSDGAGRVGYFAGCMTLLTPATMRAMEKIFSVAGENAWWADREGGVCCGRPLRLSGEMDASRKMMDYNKRLFVEHGITTLVASCPICLKVFREDYALAGIEVLHHTEYILRLVKGGRLKLAEGGATFTYHDPCELGRGSGIYDEPRELLNLVGSLIEPRHRRREALCCGSSLGNTAIDDGQQARIGAAVTAELERTGAEVIVTACPLCKKAIGRNSTGIIADISQVVADNLC